MKEKSSEVIWRQASVTRERQEVLNDHRAINLWLTGLSVSAKATLAHAVEERLYIRAYRMFVFNGDNV